MRPLLVAIALLSLALPLAAQLPAARALRAIDRADAGDTTIVVLHFDASPAVHVSEPFHLDGRVRLHVDLNEIAAAPDSAALAALAHGNLIAIVPHNRMGGTALAIDVHALGSYLVQQSDSTLTLRLTTATAMAAAPPPPAPTQTTTRAARSRAAASSPLLLFALLPASLLLWLARARRTPVPARQEAVRAPSAATSPVPDARLWAARALASDGLGMGEVARRTGLAREAVRLLQPESAGPAVSAAGGSICRAAGAPGARH